MGSDDPGGTQLNKGKRPASVIVGAGFFYILDKHVTKNELSLLIRSKNSTRNELSIIVLHLSP